MGLGIADGLISSEMKRMGQQFRSVALLLPVVSRFVLVRCGLNDVKQRKLKITVTFRII